MFLTKPSRPLLRQLRDVHFCKKRRKCRQYRPIIDTNSVSDTAGMWDGRCPFWLSVLRRCWHILGTLATPLAGWWLATWCVRHAPCGRIPHVLGVASRTCTDWCSRLRYCFYGQLPFWLVWRLANKAVNRKFAAESVFYAKLIKLIKPCRTMK